MICNHLMYYKNDARRAGLPFSSLGMAYAIMQRITPKEGQIQEKRDYERVVSPHAEEFQL